LDSKWKGSFQRRSSFNKTGQTTPTVLEIENGWEICLQSDKSAGDNSSGKKNEYCFPIANEH
jgi:hypothetical protein